MLTASTRISRICSARSLPPLVPDALMTVLFKQSSILKQWTTLLHRLDKAVNGDGRMFSQEMVLTWRGGWRLQFRREKR